VTWATSVLILGLPKPLCSRLRPDVRDRQTDRHTSDRQTSDSLLEAGHNKPALFSATNSRVTLRVISVAHKVSNSEWTRKIEQAHHFESMLMPIAKNYQN